MARLDPGFNILQVFFIAELGIEVDSKESWEWLEWDQIVVYS